MDAKFNSTLDPKVFFRENFMQRPPYIDYAAAGYTSLSLAIVFFWKRSVCIINVGASMEILPFSAAVFHCRASVVVQCENMSKKIKKYKSTEQYL